MKFSENQPSPYHHAIIPSNKRMHRWPYGLIYFIYKLNAMFNFWCCQFFKLSSFYEPNKAEPTVQLKRLLFIDSLRHRLTYGHTTSGPKTVGSYKYCRLTRDCRLICQLIVGAIKNHCIGAIENLQRGRESSVQSRIFVPVENLCPSRESVLFRPSW